MPWPSTVRAALRRAAPALVAALLFGASTPVAKLLVGEIAPLLLAGLLYLGSGVGLGLLLLLRRLKHATGPAPATAAPEPMPMTRAEWGWLLGAIVAGGMAGPALLMLGLARVDAAPAALLLNLESVFTALIAWLVFKENADRRIVVGMLAIVGGGALLSWSPGAARFAPGALLIVAASLCWAVDNNLTRKVSTRDAMVVACLKGLLAGAANTAIALLGGAAWPAWPALAGSLLVGWVGYGLSLSLFVVALRHLGAARTGAYFSVAPLFGVVTALMLWPALPGPALWVAAALMAFGVWLHVRERHVHAHTHEPLEHSHRHRHDAHHAHVHAFDWDGREPHTHPHRHDALRHRHAHVPDIHHRHLHPSAGGVNRRRARARRA
jgi:drug/metabolite transporter (DMT)-like permease